MSADLDSVRNRFASPEDVDPLDGQVPPGDRPNDGPPEAPPHDGGYDGPPDGPRTPDDDLPPEAEGALYPLNDTGNGRRFALYFGKLAMYVPRVGWHVWDGMRWKLDPDQIRVRALAQDLPDRIEAELPHLRFNSSERALLRRESELRDKLRGLSDASGEMAAEERATTKAEVQKQLNEVTRALWGKGSSRQRHRTFAQSSGNRGKIDATLTEAVTRLNRAVEDLDADPLTVNTESGVLRFKVVDLREEGAGKVAEVVLLPHEQEVSIEGRNAPQFITKLMPVKYDPEATCPGFMAFLEQVQPDPAMRAFLQRWFGLSMTALPIQKFFYCYGMGANGKSLLAGLMRRMMGDYATMVKIESLTGKNRMSGSDATPDLMKLIGARAAITNEPEEGERLQEQKVKEMTGGDAMLVRNLHSDFVEFTPYFKLTFTGNHKLEIRGTDDGIWRRPLLMPFDVQIPEGQRDEKLGDKLFAAERSGILNWMIAGLIDYLEGGLQEPAQVLDATEEYRRDSDPIGDFLTNGCEIDGGTDWIAARELIDGCYLFLLENTAHAWQPGNLSRKLKERNGKFRHPATQKTYVGHKRGVTGYSGIRLAPDLKAKLDAADRDSKGLPMLPKDQRDDTPSGYPT